MIRRIRQFYPVPVKIARGRGQFAAVGHQQLLKPGRGQAIVPRHADPFFAIIWLQTGFPEQGMAGR